MFRHLHQQLAVTILLATLGCLPARCQSSGDFTFPRLAEAPGPYRFKAFCDSPCAEWTSSRSPADSQNTQSQSSEGAFKKALRRFGKDQKEIYSAPFEQSNLKWDALFLASTGVLIATDRTASRALPGTHVDINRNISNVGLYGTSAAAGVLWLSGLATHNDHARETGVLSAEALANALPVYVALQLIAGRERPMEGSGNGRFWRNNALNSSFPSGHALFTWSMASVIAREYPRPWVKWLAYGTATVVSVTRVTGREHFPSDVVVGSVVGYFIGRHAFHVHCKVDLSEGCHVRRFRATDH